MPQAPTLVPRQVKIDVIRPSVTAFNFPVYSDSGLSNCARQCSPTEDFCYARFYPTQNHSVGLEITSRLRSQTTRMAVPARPAPSPVILLVYPVTLLLGSLFSVISPTARATRSSSPRPSDSPGALAPSLAADLHLSESPVNYFARKNNVFNLYFVKIGWVWLTIAFASLLLSQPAYRSSSSLSQPQQQTRLRRSLQAFLRYTLATTVWYMMTQWFFGPAMIDRSFVITGGKCEEALYQVGKAGADMGSSADLQTLFTAATCKAAGGAWRGGHDISGHVFMLVLATAVLAFEAIGAGAVAASPSTARANGEAARERKTSDPDATATSDQIGISEAARTWSMRLVWGVVILGWWMLFMTAIWFHTWLEKVCLRLSLLKGYSRYMSKGPWLTLPSTLVVRLGYCFELCICHLHTTEKTSAVEGHCGTARGIDSVSPCISFVCIYHPMIDSFASEHDSATTNRFAFIHDFATKRYVKILIFLGNLVPPPIVGVK